MVISPDDGKGSEDVLLVLLQLALRLLLVLLERGEDGLLVELGPLLLHVEDDLGADEDVGDVLLAEGLHQGLTDLASGVASREARAVQDAGFLLAIGVAARQRVVGDLPLIQRCLQR